MTTTQRSAMAATVNASVEGLKRVDVARRKKGWKKSDKAWADLACTSVATLKRFWAYTAIQTDTFRDICTVVGVEDWESVIDFEEAGKQESQISSKRLSFAIAGSIEEIDAGKLKAIVALLQKLGGDTTIEILDVEEGSIRLILGGSDEALERIEALYQSGELKQVEGFTVENVHFTSKNELVAFMKKADAISRNLSGVNLSGANLKGINLRGINLEDADLSHAYLGDTNLSGANLSGANLSGAKLFHARLDQAKLVRADLEGANLSRAKLFYAELRDANLKDTDLIGTKLFHTDLSNANFGGADLSTANLSDANLLYTDFCSANLSGTNLSSTNLRGANLRGANLSGANLWYANLDGACVEQCIMTGSTGLSSEKVKELKKRGAIFEDSPGDRESAFSPRPLVPR